MVRLTTDLLLKGYAMGVFPMAESREDQDVHWIDPHMRGVIPLDGFRISRSLRKTLIRQDYQVRLNHDFAGTLAACADRPETWINDTLVDLYGQLHARGYAHSLEIWRDGAMIGGVYGVSLGAAFFGESMFSRARDGSKIALAWLVARLRYGGFQLFDAQFLTSHLASLGAVEIPRSAYQTQLRAALMSAGRIEAMPNDTPPRDVFAKG